MLRKPHARLASARLMSAGEASTLAADAYIFGYPLVLMDVTRQVAIANGTAGDNAFVHLREFPDASFTDVVTPNADTLYSQAWLDLSDQPIVLSVPDMGARYYVMQLLDAWTNVFANPGTRTTGQGRGHFAIVGPTWRGILPESVTALRAPTNMVWLLGRTQTNGARDYPAVHEIQDKYLLTPFDRWGSSAAAFANGDAQARTTTSLVTPVEQVARMDAHTFFGCLNVLMEANPPAAGDARALDRFALLGVHRGPPLDADGTHPALTAGMSVARTRLMELVRGPLGNVINGWEIPPRDIGKYGTNYKLRAAVAMTGLGANLPGDAVYPHAITDSDGKPLNGASKYVITFARDRLPPAHAFWSITAYNDQLGFAANPLGRYAIGDRDDLIAGEDGTVTVYIQHASPDDGPEANWLPVPDGAFSLVMRLYWPSKSVLNGSWKPPGIRRVG